MIPNPKNQTQSQGQPWLIKGGRVIDDSSSREYYADIWVKHGEIVEIEDKTQLSLPLELS